MGSVAELCTLPVSQEAKHGVVTKGFRLLSPPLSHSRALGSDLLGHGCVRVLFPAWWKDHFLPLSARDWGRSQVQGWENPSLHR